MKKFKKIGVILGTMLLFLLLGTVSCYAGDLHLNQLDFQVQIKSDGSMDVVETWDIDIEETNTLYKTFQTDQSRYSGIQDVKVSEITKETQTPFMQVENWAYHVNKGSYYGTYNKKGNFEIGWGIGMDNSTGVRTYKIQYTVQDAIAKYEDAAELYWQFVGNDFEVDADEITGTILLPERASNLEDIRVWGHTKNMNGEIHKVDLNQVEFRIDRYRSGKFVEVRVLMPTEMIVSSGRSYSNVKHVDTVLKEEEEWVNEANRERERNERLAMLAAIVVFVIEFLISVKLYQNWRKNKRKLQEMPEAFKPEQEHTYFRDVPRKDATPGEATIIIRKGMGQFLETEFGNIISSTLLQLKLDNKIDFEVHVEEKKKDKISIILLEESTTHLEQDETVIYQFLRKASNKKDKISMTEFEKYIRNHPSEVVKLREKLTKALDSSLQNKGIMTAEGKQEYNKIQNQYMGYSVSAFVVFMMTFILLALHPSGFVMGIVMLILLILNITRINKILKRVNAYTQKGVNEVEEWKGLKKYMEEYSLLKEKEVPDIVIWEQFLVYATAFGIAKEVIKQLKMVYPNYAEINSSSHVALYLMMNTNFNQSFSHSVNSSIASTYSSATGGGGGFSGGGGGGGGRRRWRRKISVSFLYQYLNFSRMRYSTDKCLKKESIR